MKDSKRCIAFLTIFLFHRDDTYYLAIFYFCHDDGSLGVIRNFDVKKTHSQLN